MASKQISAVGIKKLYYTDVLQNEPNTANDIKTLIESATEVKNVHQDTWTLDEGENSQDSYRNQLTGAVYRMGTKTMGEIVVNFTIGRYEFQTKADLLGGTATNNSWKRARGIVTIHKAIIALTEDDVYCVLPQCNLNTREANTDGAIGLAVAATAMEPDIETISPEIWIDADLVEEGS